MQSISRKKCKVCKDSFIQLNHMQVVCCPMCALELVKAKKAKAERKETKERKEALKTRSDYMKDAQIAFNAFIRARDKDKPCISCGTPLKLEAIGGGYDCGHYRSVGSAPHMRFNDDNAHGQCKKCNRYLSGNAIEYRKGLIERIGQERVDIVERDQTVRKYAIEGLKQIVKDYKALTKAIQCDNSTAHQ